MNNDVYEIVKQRLKELEEPQRLLPLLKTNTLNGHIQANWHQAPRLPHSWLEYMIHPHNPTMIGWTMCERVLENQELLFNSN